MTKKNKNLVFTNTLISRNVDVISSNDKFVSYLEGAIHNTPNIEKIFRYIENYTEEKKPEKVFLGEYLIYLVDLKGMRENNVDFYDTLNYLSDDKYGDDAVISFLGEFQKNKELRNELLEKDKLILISYVIVSSNNMKQNTIMNELLKMLRKNFFSEKTMFVGYFKPIQYNNYFLNLVLPHKKIEAKKQVFGVTKNVSATNFYKINQYLEGSDYEYDSLKLHSLAIKIGLKPLNQKKNLFFVS